MLLFNVMIGLQFNNEQFLPDITFISFGKEVFAQGDFDQGNTVDCYSNASENFTADYYDCEKCTKEKGIAEGTKKSCVFKPILN